jgi:ATP-binding protein involved in chromosome partitioning
MSQTQPNSNSGVKHIIAVASGKGGVGKSSTAVNLALAMKALGKNVGILDADIYGPSIPSMLGVKQGTRPQVSQGNRLVPLEAHGLQFMSMGVLATDDTPMVWRGPMASGALVQILEQTLWHELDVLVVDMPPGTGDIQLTLAQKAAVDGAVVVTTPQDIALLDAVKGIEMFRKVSIPVFGLVENMAVHICSSCGHSEHIFGAGGADRVAAKYQTPVLGSLPLDIHICEDLDDGIPTPVKNPDGEVAAAYRQIAEKVLQQLESGEGLKGPEIVIE